jgi:hypothetical protein
MFGDGQQKMEKEKVIDRSNGTYRPSIIHRRLVGEKGYEDREQFHHYDGMGKLGYL